MLNHSPVGGRGWTEGKPRQTATSRSATGASAAPPAPATPNPYSSLNSGQLPLEPGPGVAPISFDRPRRKRHGVGGLFDGQTSEVAELDQSRGLRIDGRELVERFVHGEQLGIIDGRVPLGYILVQINS